jgi:hypothetical protein
MPHRHERGRFPRATIHAGILVIMTLWGTSNAAAHEGDDPLPHVRSESVSITATICAASERSPTFRRLVEMIDASDGLVYVQEGKCSHGVRACLTMSVLMAGPYRLLRIYVDTRKAVGTELMAAIGHELWHAIEALDDPHVTDNRSIYHFFERIGQTGSERFETQDAIKIGLSVLNEVMTRASGGSSPTLLDTCSLLADRPRDDPRK